MMLPLLSEGMVQLLQDCTQCDHQCQSPLLGAQTRIAAMERHLEPKQAILQCLKPCQFTTYIESRLEKYEMTYLKPDPNEAYFELVLNHVRTVEKEVLVYDTNDMIAAIGGFLGLFLGFSFFGVISGCMEHFIQMVNHLNLVWTNIKLAISEVK